MKAFENLTSTDKWALLTALFPEQKQPILDFVKQKCISVKNDEQQLRASWEEKQFVSFETWFGVTVDMERMITNDGEVKFGGDEEFPTQLFTAYFNITVVQYAIAMSKNRKFELTVALLYAHDFDYSFTFKKNE